MLVLLNPETYKAYPREPILKDYKQVSKATIGKTFYGSGYDLNIYFVDGDKYYDWSPSIRGSKKIFSFQSCEVGSKWINNE